MKSNRAIHLNDLFKFGPFPTSFFIFVVSIQLIVHKFFADEWIQTAGLWCQKRPLYQLRHNHFPLKEILPHDI